MPMTNSDIDIFLALTFCHSQMRTFQREVWQAILFRYYKNCFKFTVINEEIIGLTKCKKAQFIFNKLWIVLLKHMIVKHMMFSAGDGEFIWTFSMDFPQLGQSRPISKLHRTWTPATRWRRWTFLLELRDWFNFIILFHWQPKPSLVVL